VLEGIRRKLEFTGRREARERGCEFFRAGIQMMDVRGFRQRGLFLGQ